MELTSRFLRSAPMPACIQVALAAHHPELALRDDLDPEAARRLWESGLDVTYALALVAGPLDAELRARIVASEKRQTVLSAFLARHWDDLDATQRQKVTKRVRGKAALELIRRLGPDEQRALLARLDSTDRIAWIAEQAPTALDDEALLGTLEGIAAWLPSGTSRSRRKRSLSLELLAHFRPVCLELLVTECPANELSAIAGVLTLDDPTLQGTLLQRIIETDQRWAAMALGANPVATETTLTALAAWARAQRHGDLYELVERVLQRRKEGVPHITGAILDCTDAMALTAAIRRAEPGDWRPAGRPVQLAYLMGAQYLDEGCVRRLLDSGYHACGSMPEWVATTQLDRLAARIEVLGGPHMGAEDLAEMRERLYLTPRRFQDDDEHAPAPTPVVAAEPGAEPWRNLTMVELERGLYLIGAANTALLAGVDVALGEDPAAWELLCSFLGSFTGRFGDLVDTVRASAG